MVEMVGVQYIRKTTDKETDLKDERQTDSVAERFPVRTAVGVRGVACSKDHPSEWTLACILIAPNMSLPPSAEGHRSGVACVPFSLQGFSGRVSRAAVQRTP